MYVDRSGSDKIQTYILYKLKTPQRNFNIYQHSIKF